MCARTCCMHPHKHTHTHTNTYAHTHLHTHTPWGKLLTVDRSVIVRIYSNMFFLKNPESRPIMELNIQRKTVLVTWHASLRVSYIVKHTHIHTHIMATFSTSIRLAHTHTHVYTGISVVILSSHLSMAVLFLITRISSTTTLQLQTLYTTSPVKVVLE